MQPTDRHRKTQNVGLSQTKKFSISGARATVSAVVAVVATTFSVGLAPATTVSGDKGEPTPSVVDMPQGTVAGTDVEMLTTPVSPAVETARIESWTPSSYSVTEDGQTTLDLFSRPEFKREADGWVRIDSTITKGSKKYPFEALGLANPVRFGASADELVTIETVNGPIVFGLKGATMNAPTLNKGVVTYADVFEGVDLEFRTDGGRLGKHLVLANEDSPTQFQFTITDPEHWLGDPTEGEYQAWSFSKAVAFGTGITLPSPAAWSQKTEDAGLPGSADQHVELTADGYEINLSVNALWAETAQYPLVLDPAVEWIDDIWTYDNGIASAFAPIGATDCDGEPCPLVDPIDGVLWTGTAPVGMDTLDFRAYVATDVGRLGERPVSSALLGGYDYATFPTVSSLCDVIDATSTGVDLDNAQCGSSVDALAGWGHAPGWWWHTDITDEVNAALDGTGPTGTAVGFAIGRQDGADSWWINKSIRSPQIRLVYDGYPVPRPLMLEQTFGCECFAGGSSTNQALAADPVNTATGGLIEHFPDVSIAGVGQSIDLARTYNSLDTRSGPFGPGWSFSYGASIVENTAGELVLTDGSGTQTRFGALVGGGYAPIDPAVSATLTEGANGTHVIRNLAGNTMTFDGDGKLVAAADERGQGVTLGYVSDTLTTVTDTLGQTLTFGWDTGTGPDARIVSATTSDGRTLGFTYANSAGAKRLMSATAVDGATTTYAYTSAGWLSGITDPLGNVSARNTFDAHGRVISQLDQTDAITTFAYDDVTQTTTITDPTGMIRIDVYDGFNLVKQIDGNGDEIEQFYDGNNNGAATLNAAGQLHRNTYDARDRLVRRGAPEPLNYTEVWTYDDEDRVTSYTDADEFTTRYTYNAAGLVTEIEHPNWTFETFTYTDGTGGVPENLLATSTDALGRSTTYTYNSVGDLISTTSPGGHTTTNTYDAAHRLISTTSPAGATTSYTYDNAGRMLTMTDAGGAVTTHTYDAGGRLTKTTDDLGRDTMFTYDAADRLVSTTDAANTTTTTTYDDAGRVATTTDKLGAITTYGYDNAGRLISTTDPLGRTTTTDYNEAGQVASVTDPTGAITSYTHDVIGQVTSVTDPDGITHTMTYDRRGNLTQTEDAAGGFQQTIYDIMGRPQQIRDSDGVYTSYTYDLAGQLLEETKPRTTSTSIPGYWSDRTSYTYDLDGRMTEIVDPRGNVPGAAPEDFTTTIAYDADGRPTTVTDPLGRTTTTAYDATGRPTTVTDPAGNTTTTHYNPLGWITSVDGAGTGTTTYGYDLVGNLTSRVDPLSRTTAYTYDAAGQLLTHTDPLGRVTAMTYDSAGNLTKTIRPSGTAATANPSDGTVSYTYDLADRLTSTSYSDNTATIEYDYSTAGRITLAERIGGSAVVASSGYSYDDAGRVESIVRSGPGGGQTDYSYTSGGRLSGVVWSTGAGAGFDYNEIGSLAKVTPVGVGGVPGVEYGYDPAGQIVSVTRDSLLPVTSNVSLDGAGQLASLSHMAGSTVVKEFEVTRDVRGLPTQVDTTTSAGITTALYDFDMAGRVVSECYPTTGTTCDSTVPSSLYAYDDVGNRTTSTVTTITGTTPSTVVTDYAYDDGDQLLTQTVNTHPAVSNTWSANGTLVSSTTGTGTTTYTSDLADELISVVLEDATEATYSHDVHGNRTSRAIDGVLDVSWGWDELSALPVRIGQYDHTDTLTSIWLPDPTSSTGQPLTHTDVTSTDSQWLLADPFMNVTTTIDTTTSTLSGHSTLDVFGNHLSTATGTLADSPVGFAGQHLDTVTGLYDMRARDYHPGTGRFTAQDPIHVPTGMPYFASYVYGHNNPLIYTDPTGLWSWEQWQAFFTVDASTFEAGALGLVNFGGGALNAATSTVNELSALSPYRYAIECATGANLDIPSVGIAGDYDKYKYSSWVGSGTTWAATSVAGAVGSGAAVTRGSLTAASSVPKAPQVLRVGEVKLPAVPKGAVGKPTQTGKGIEYSIPRGTPELSDKVARLRVMDPVTNGAYQYPNGYAVYMNSSGQTINPLTGQTITNFHPFAHLLLP